MKKAAAAHDFEKAADLRDLIRDLKDTWKKTEKFERVPYNLPLAINPAKRSGANSRRFWVCPRRRSGSKASTFPTSAARSPWRRW